LRSHLGLRLRVEESDTADGQHRVAEGGSGYKPTDTITFKGSANDAIDGAITSKFDMILDRDYTDPGGEGPEDTYPPPAS